MPTAALVELAGRRVVVDCGIGVTRALVAAGVDLRDGLEIVLITHLHSDHLLELGPLLHTAWTTGTRRPIRVFGPPGLADYWRHFLAAMACDNRIRVEDEGRPPLESLVTVTEIDAGEVLRDEGLAIDALRVPHPPLADCFAFRIEGAGRRVVISGDTAHHPPLARFARGADVLVHEAMLPAGIERLVARTGLGDLLRRHMHAAHSTAAEAARIAAAAGARHLVLAHLVPADDPEIGEEDWIAEVRPHYDGPVTVARDGTRIALADAGRPANGG
ncbi:MAG: MBL fold metallo-hydrolase [Alphaproteobacteria bacterium]|nr:MAG: MBL fold metallo-hydrolase [Alphaproteobacteria bacterium]